MAVKGEILIKNHEGNVLPGPRDNETSLVYEFNHEVYLPYEKEENKIQGSRKITAFEIVKAIDKLTPQLYAIVCNGMMCKEIKITLYRIGMESGEEEPYFYYNLKDAKIVSVKNWMPPTYITENEGVGHLEIIKMLAKEFEWEFIEGGITYLEQAF
ncbi:MAG: type VI secretion system tube protein TssD [Ignavibacteriaceae bacterium]|jgi:type VI secretion system secreted protein Hcp|nr:type VI secretion system tube protein TssD [Ignavibacteriaceae bacterium]